MKKMLPFLMLLLVPAFQLVAQAPKAVSINENFDGVALPSGWTIVDSLSDNNTWEFVTVYPVAYTLDGTPFAIVNSDAAGMIAMSEQLISPTVNVASNALVIIEFDQYFHYFGGGGTETGRVDVWNGSAWINVYTASSDQGGWSTPNHQYIDASAYKNANFKVRFYYKGANNDYWWAVDNVKIWDPQPNDVGIASLVAPTNGFGMGTEAISVSVKNYGTTAQTSIPVSYQVDGGSVVNETLNSSYTGFTSLAPGAEFTYAFTATYDFSAYQTYNVKTWTGLATDTDHANDTISTVISNSPQLVQNTFDQIPFGTIGVETDGNFFYVSYSTEPGTFGKYTLTGNLVDTFHIPACTVGIRDMAYDITTGHFFGGAASPVIYELDLISATPSLIGSVSTPTSVRYIAYDHVRDGFWIGNNNGDIYLVNKSGSTMTSAGIVNPILNSSLTGLGNRYGLAFDDWSCPSEYLWVFCQPGTPSNVYLAEVDIYTGLPTGRSVDLATQIAFTGSVPSAGGLFTHPDLITGTVSVGGLVVSATSDSDPNMIFIADLQGLHPDQPMVINSIFPADGANQVQLDHRVMLWISEPFVINDTALIQISDGATTVSIDSVVVHGDTINIYHVPFLGETTYTVTFQAGAMTGLCSDNTDFSWSFTTGVTGVNEVSGSNIAVFPNPASESFVISNAEGAHFRLYSITGTCVVDQNIVSPLQTIDVAYLSNGMYLAEWLLNGVRQTNKIIIQK